MCIPNIGLTILARIPHTFHAVFSFPMPNSYAYMYHLRLNITWIYLFSLSVYLSSFYCHLRICWLWWVIPKISVSPSLFLPQYLFVLSPTAWRQLSFALRVPYVYMSQAPLCCAVNSVLSIPADSFKYGISLLWMFSSPETLYDHLCIVFLSISPHPLSPLMICFCAKLCVWPRQRPRMSVLVFVLTLSCSSVSSGVYFVRVRHKRCYFLCFVKAEVKTAVEGNTSDVSPNVYIFIKQPFRFLCLWPSIVPE